MNGFESQEEYIFSRIGSITVMGDKGSKLFHVYDVEGNPIRSSWCSSRMAPSVQIAFIFD